MKEEPVRKLGLIFAALLFAAGCTASGEPAPLPAATPPTSTESVSEDLTYIVTLPDGTKACDDRVLSVQILPGEPYVQPYGTWTTVKTADGVDIVITVNGSVPNIPFYEIIVNGTEVLRAGASDTNPSVIPLRGYGEITSVVTCGGGM